ncbi:MAG: ABC transporter permease [Gemmatimonadaceae bacterium]
MRFLRRLAFLLRQSSRQTDLAEEVAAHRSMLERDLREQGLSPGAARDAARRAMGNETYMREEARSVWLWPWLATFAQDLRYGARSLVRAPAFLLLAISTLALGVGANSAMFGIVDALLFRPPPRVRAPETIVRVEVELPARGGSPSELSDLLSYPDFVDLRDGARGFSEVAAYVHATRAVGEGDNAQSALIILASGSYFPLLGSRPALGRILTPADDRENAALPVAVLSWDYWQRAYGGDPGALNSTIRVAGRPYTVVGVAERHFVGSDLVAPALWVPLGTAWAIGFDQGLTRMRFGVWLSALARLAPGVTRELAGAAARSALSAGREGQPDVSTPGKTVDANRGPQVRLTSLAGAGPLDASGSISSPRLPVSLWFLAVTGIVLLIACANVANLLLARATRRAHELAVRASIGATRMRLVRQLMAESLVLATLGGLSGFAIALGGIRLLPRVIPLPPLSPLVDLRLLMFTLLLTGGTTLVFGVAPAVRAARADLLSTLNANNRAGGARTPARNALVVVQLAASVVLLVSAALFLRSLRNVKAIDPGFAVQQLLEVSGDTRAAPLTPEQSDAFWRRSLVRVRGLPGVRAAALGAALPFEEAYRMPVSGAAGAPVAAQPDFADPGYFATLGISIIEGRAFTDADQYPGAPATVIVNQKLARQLFGSESATGRCIRAGPLPRDVPCAQVVGVAADAKYADVSRDAVPFFYRPLGARPAGQGWGTVLHLRTVESPARLVDAVRRELLALDPSLMFVRVRPLTELLAPQLVPWRTGSFIFSLLGVLGLLLAAIGLYGVIALLVAQRTHELGVRLALGAATRDVLLLVIGQGARLVAAGLVLGALGAAAVSRLYASLIFGVSRVDPAAYLIAGAVLAGVALIAVYAPARRATRVDPLVALREQ